MCTIGSALYIGTAVHDRYHARHNALLNDVSENMSSRVAAQINAGKLAAVDKPVIKKVFLLILVCLLKY